MRALVAAVALAAIAAHSSSALTLYTTPEQAAKHCRGTIIWLNTTDGFYYFAGSRGYGTTMSGGYGCQAAADKAGKRPAVDAAPLKI